MNSVLKCNDTLNIKTQKFINDQLEWIDSEIGKNKTDPYWNLVEGLIAQLRGMHRGYTKKVEDISKHDQNFDFSHFYYLTNMGDLEDVIPAFEYEEKNADFHECSGFIKLLADDLVTSHNTHNM